MSVGSTRYTEAVERLYDLEQRQQLDEWSALWAENVVVSFPLAVDPETSRIRGKSNLVELTRRKFEDRDKVVIDLRVESLADERRVLAHLDATIDFASGERLELPLLCLFTFDQDGLIAAMDEYLNEALVAARLGSGPDRDSSAPG